MRPARLNHIGIALGPGTALRDLLALLGFGVNHSEPVPEQGVTTHFVPLASDPQIELLEITDPAGTVAKFVEKRGPGVHHLSFEVERGALDGLCAKLRAKGVRLVYDQPRAGAHGMRITFVHPGSAGGVLVELMEPGGDA